VNGWYGLLANTPFRLRIVRAINEDEVSMGLSKRYAYDLRFVSDAGGWLLSVSLVGILWDGLSANHGDGGAEESDESELPGRSMSSGHRL
jgi:hypothetical protein